MDVEGVHPVGWNASFFFLFGLFEFGFVRFSLFFVIDIYLYMRFDKFYLYLLGSVSRGRKHSFFILWSMRF